MAQADQFEVRYGYDATWLDKAIQIYNKTEMKRNNSEKVGRVEWDRSPLEAK